MDLKLINENDQEYANKKLAKFYENQLIPAEKKSYLTELQNNNGPFMGVETESGETHYLLDAASQIATLGLGFSPSVFMGTAHFNSSWTNNPDHKEVALIKEAFSSFIKRQTGWSQLDMTICNSGAEANEIALGYAFKTRKNRKAKKVLAFEGSFHGRMMISLFSTWNESKREPFQWPGYETEFTEYPELPGSEINLSYPDLWRESWDMASKNEFSTPKAWNLSDPILAKEVESLLKIRKALLKKDIFSIIVEPMQCEGGDRYSSDRFHTALLLMARAFEVQVIHDEVQSGFHLGRAFFWHRMFCLTDQAGKQLKPDYLVCAKKAQVGMVLAPNAIPFKNQSGTDQYQVASLIRGYLHAIALDQSRSKILDLEKKALQHLEDLHASFPEHFCRPRACGISFAIDLKDNSNVAAFISKRFNHGLLYYPAGSNTLRFRLNTAFTDEDLKFLFERLTEISNEVFNKKESKFNGKVSTVNKDTKGIKNWQALILDTRFKNQLQTPANKTTASMANINALLKSDLKTVGFEIELITSKNFSGLKDNISDLQKRIYEPTRQTEIEKFEKCSNSNKGVCIAIKKGEQLAGIAFSSPLKDHPFERGLRQDPDFNNENCLYMIDTTVDTPFQGLGLGRILKYSLTLLAMEKGIEKIKGRNRDQFANSMLNINLSIGSFEQNYLREDYPDFQDSRDVLYYQTPLSWENSLNLSNRINSLVDIEDVSPEFLESQLPYLSNKVCLSNFVSERFLEHVKAILDVLPSQIRHGYTASGQSECVDKVAKSILYNFKDKFQKNKKFLTFEGHYFGEGSFLSRSLSQECSENYFPIERLPQPTEENMDVVLSAVESLLKSGNIISTWIEPVTQMTLEQVPQAFLKKLRELCSQYDSFLVYNETASKEYSYSNENYFISSNDKLMPDAGFSFLGGQAAIVFLKEELFISKPLMMISTWDGDEHAFASFHEGMSNIISNKSDFLETRSLFQKKLKEELEMFSLESLHLEKGRGFLKGPIPNKISKCLSKKSGRYFIDPTYSSMKSYLATNGMLG